MAKHKTVDVAEISDAARKADDLHYELLDLANRVRSSELEHGEMIEHARNLTNLARVASDLAGAILTSMAMQADRASIERRLKAQLAAQ
jgi:hypothetical protein